MDEDYNMVYGIDKLAELLIERGIKFFVNDEFSLAFKDGVGNWHECWMAGAEENLVNVMIVVTPEQAISVPDLNGVISENAKLKAKADAQWSHIKKLQAELSHCIEKSSRDYDRDLDRRRRLATENAKLRELCADMWRDIPKTESCGWDMSANICTGYDECHGECALWYRMHDLGIEA